MTLFDMSEVRHTCCLKYVGGGGGAETCSHATPRCNTERMYNIDIRMFSCSYTRRIARIVIIAVLFLFLSLPWLSIIASSTLLPLIQISTLLNATLPEYVRHKEPPNNKRSTPMPVTIVSAFVLPVNGSKHSLEDYMSWMPFFFKSVSAPIVLFLAGYSEDIFREMRGDLPMQIIPVESALDLPSEDLNPRVAYTYEQWMLDKEKSIHTPELYSIWNSKFGMLANVSRSNPFQSQYFLWVDAGAFRARFFRSWPSTSRVLSSFARRPNGMLFSLVGSWSDMLIEAAKSPHEIMSDIGFSQTAKVQGGFFGGSKSAILTFASAYYALLRTQISRGIFIGKDQDNMNILSAQNLSLHSFYVPGESECGLENNWLTFTYAFAEGENCSSKTIVCYDV